MTTPDHLIPFTLNDRGIRTMPAVVTPAGTSLRISESSASGEPYMWLTIIDADGTAIRLHLHVDQAAKFAEQVTYLAANHYQVQE